MTSRAQVAGNGLVGRGGVAIAAWRARAASSASKRGVGAHGAGAALLGLAGHDSLAITSIADCKQSNVARSAWLLSVLSGGIKERTWLGKLVPAERLSKQCQS